MNIVEQAKDYINGMGVEQAADLFKVKQATVNNWVKTGRFPQEVFQQMFTPTEEPTIEELSAPTPVAAPEPEYQTQPQPELSIGEIMQHLQEHANHINELYALVVQLQQARIQGQVPGHMPTTSRVNVQPDQFGRLPGLVMQEAGVDSMVRPSAAIMPRIAQAPVVRDAAPTNMPMAPRNPDPNHWTKPKQIIRSDRR